LPGFEGWPPLRYAASSARPCSAFSDAQAPAVHKDVHPRQRLAEGVYSTTTETRTLAGLSLRELAPEILNKNSSCPLYPGDDLYVTSG
jgi:hypothetical protein